MNVFVRQLKGEEAPSVATFSKLWTTSVKLRDLAPWTYLSGTQVFVVEPSPGRVFYAHIMGELGEVLRFQMYAGAAGYWVIHDMQSQALPLEPSEVFSRTTMLYVEFVPSNELTKPDRDAMKLIAAPQQRGKPTPQFRSAQRNCLPWYPTEAEAAELTAAIELAVPFLSNEAKLDSGAYWGDMRRRLPWIDPGGKITLEPVPSARVTGEDAFPFPVSEAALRKVRDERLPQLGAVEIDVFPSPMPIEPPSARPYFGSMALCADATSGMIFAPTVEPSNANPGDLIVRTLLDAIHSSRFIPNEVRVAGEANRIRLAPCCEALGIRITVTDRLPMLAEARGAFLAYLSSGSQF